MSKIIISDTSCLIALDRIKQLELLHRTFTSIITTNEVQAEFGSTLPSWISIHDVKDTNKLRELESIIDKGEASAIALALETNDSVLIIDERKGRKLARELNINIIGTLKILLIAKKKGIVPSVKQLIEQLEKNNFRFSKPIINEILKEAGEI